jgi:hypothetical protein
MLFEVLPNKVQYAFEDFRVIFLDFKKGTLHGKA